LFTHLFVSLQADYHPINYKNNEIEKTICSCVGAVWHNRYGGSAYAAATNPR
jgi:hypothetical protein